MTLIDVIPSVSLEKSELCGSQKSGCYNIAIFVLQKLFFWKSDTLHF